MTKAYQKYNSNNEDKVKEYVLPEINYIQDRYPSVTKMQGTVSYGQLREKIKGGN